MSKRYVYLIAGVMLVAVVVDATAQRGRGAARARVSSRASSSSRSFTPQQSLPSNYGSLRDASTRQAVREVAPRIQPIADSGSRETYRGGDVEWRKGQDGRAAVKGETARGRSYGGAQNKDGDRVAAAKTWNGNVVARDRDGNTGAYSKVGDNWEQVNYVGVPYYYHSYHWYYPYYYSGHVYYHEVYPPADATVDELPKGAKVVEIDGREYILWDGVYYVNVSGTYKVVEVPKSGAAGGDPIDILRRMNKFLSAQQTLFVQTDELIAVPTGQGKFKNSRIAREIAVSRPNKLRVRRREGKVPAKQFWYDGANATVLTSGQSFYGQVPFAGKLPELRDMLQRDYAVTLPLGDLLHAGLADSLSQSLQTSLYVGLEKVDGRECHHIKLTTGQVEGDLWIDALDTAPYPRKVVLRYPKTPGQPTYEARLTKWATGQKLAKSVFAFAAPKGVRQIEMLPVQ